jgi:exodeoxyribonuclease V alpha subunit
MGTIKINEEIQKIIHGSDAKNNKKYIEYGDKTFFENDLVIQTKNNYELFMYDDNLYAELKERPVFNGEVGQIIKILDKGMVIKFDDDLIFYNKFDMGNLSLAYSISCHKSQGSGFNNVIVITPKAHTYMLNSNLLYVACTRARQKVIHIGDSSVVNKVIKKKANWDRKTYLKDLLMEV